MHTLETECLAHFANVPCRRVYMHVNFLSRPGNRLRRTQAMRARQGLPLAERSSPRLDGESHAALRAAALQISPQKPPTSARRHLELPKARGINKGVTLSDSRLKRNHRSG